MNGFCIESIKCPSCGAPQQMTSESCEYCGSPVIITSINTLNSMPLPLINKYINSYNQQIGEATDSVSIKMSCGLCYLKLKLYNQALECFEDVIKLQYDNAEAYFYSAICLLKGNKPFVTPREVINKIDNYLEASISVSPRALFYYFRAYIRYDHHYRKFYIIKPNYKDLLTKAYSLGIGNGDKNMLFSLLGQSKPEIL